MRAFVFRRPYATRAPKRIPSPLSIYEYALMSEGLDETPKTKINRGFALLAMSRWMKRQEALEIFETVADKHDKHVNLAVSRGKRMAASTKHPNDRSGGSQFYYFDHGGRLKKFTDKNLGFGELVGSTYI